MARLNSCFCHLLADGQQSDVSAHKAEETFIVSTRCSASWHCRLRHCFHLGLSSRFLLVSPGSGSRRSRRPNITPPAEASLQPACPGEQGLARSLQQPRTAIPTFPSRPREAPLHAPRCCERGDLSSPAHPSTPPQFPPPQGWATGCEGAVVGGRSSSSSCTFLPFPFQGSGTAKLGRKLLVSASFLSQR